MSTKPTTSIELEESSRGWMCKITITVLAAGQSKEDAVQNAVEKWQKSKLEDEGK